MVSNRVKRNISGTLLVIGCLCILGRIIDVIDTPASARAWFQLCGILLLTYLCFDDFRIYRRRIKAGIKFGDRPTASSNKELSNDDH